MQTNMTRLHLVLFGAALLWTTSACSDRPAAGDEAGYDELTAYFLAETAEQININQAGIELLDTLPGIGPTLAARIIAFRNAEGLFGEVAELVKVRGIGAGTLTRLRPFVTVDDAPLVAGGDECAGDDTRLNINEASAAELDVLPGVGPTLAARIVAERNKNGPYTSTDKIQRVRGIGAGTFTRLADQIRVGPAGQCEDAEEEVVEPPPLEGPDEVEAVVELRKVHVNEDPAEELLALPGVGPAEAHALVERRLEVGYWSTLAEIEAEICVDTSDWGELYTLFVHQVFFTPFAQGASGYAERNRDKVLAFQHSDGQVEALPADIQNAFVDLVNRTPDGGLIQLAIYGYSTRTPEHAAIVEAVEGRGVRLQVVIDTSVKNSRGVPYSADEIAAFQALNGDVEVRRVRYTSKAMHQKFAIFDGRHVMNGSANISTRAHSRYDETRMVFWNNQHIAEAFEAEFERLFVDLGVAP